MLDPFMTLNDNTEIVHSESYMENGREQVRVEIEKPVEGGFASAECILPDYHWNNIEKFTDADIEKLQELLQSVAHIIMQLAREVGFDNASGF